MSDLKPWMRHKEEKEPFDTLGATIVVVCVVFVAFIVCKLLI